jgi:hypothetical protein
MLTRFIETLLREGVNALAEKAEKPQSGTSLEEGDAPPGKTVVLGEVLPPAAQRNACRTPFRQSLETRYRGTFFTGTTGSGKSTALSVLTDWDIDNGVGLCNVDASGDSTDALLARLAAQVAPEVLRESLLLYDLRVKSPFSGANEPVMGFNPLTALADDPFIAVARFLNVLRQIWGEAALGVRLLDQLHHSLLALGLSPSGPYSLVDVEPFLLEPAFRRTVLQGITNPVVTRYFARYETGKDREGEAEAVLNKLTPLLSTHQRLRRTLSTTQKAVSLPEFLATAKTPPYILICTDSGGAGKQVSGIIASLFLNAIVEAALPSHVEPGKGMSFPLHIVLDEVVNYSAACREPLDKVLREGRRYKCLTSLTTQSPSLLDSHLRTLVTNVIGNQAYFAQGIEDANQIAGLLAGDNLPKPQLRESLLTAPPGVALVRRQGHPLQRVQMRPSERPKVSREVVQKVRAAVLAYRGAPTEEPPMSSKAPPDTPNPLNTPPASLAGYEFDATGEEEVSPRSPRRKKHS